MTSWPLTTVLVRLAWLRALCGVAEGASVSIPAPAANASGSCVAAVLGEAMQRLCIFGGRSGMPRSLGSVLGCLVARFLGGFQGCKSRCILAKGQKAWCSSVAISRDGSKLLVGKLLYGVDIFCLATGVHLRAFSGFGNAPLQMNSPCQIWVASDDFVFIADWDSNRIQVLTPQFEFHGFVGVGNLAHPAGVCADDAIVAASEDGTHRISVFSRVDGALIRRFGSKGSGNGELKHPRGLCFVGGNGLIAVADRDNKRISVFRVDGEFVRTVGAAKLWYPTCIACSASGDELIVAHADTNRIQVFSGSDEMLHEGAMPGISFSRFAVYGNTIIALDSHRVECVVFT